MSVYMTSTSHIASRWQGRRESNTIWMTPRVEHTSDSAAESPARDMRAATVEPWRNLCYGATYGVGRHLHHARARCQAVFGNGVFSADNRLRTRSFHRDEKTCILLRSPVRSWPHGAARMRFQVSLQGVTTIIGEAKHLVSVQV